MEVSALCCVAAALVAQGSPGPPPPDPLGVTAAASDDAVPIGASLEFNGTVTGGTTPVNVRHESFYGDAPCRTGTELGDGEAVNGTHSAPMTVFAAGAHAVVVTATDSSNPPLTATVTVTVTGLPPDTLTPDATVNDCTFRGDVYDENLRGHFREDIRIHVRAGQEKMGPLYENSTAYPQEQVYFTERVWNGPDGRFESDWKPWAIISHCKDPWGQMQWAPQRPGFLTELVYRPLEGNGEGSYIHDGKGAPVNDAMLTNLETKPVGFDVYAQKQKVRVQFTRGCDIDYKESDDWFYVVLETTDGLRPQFQHPLERYRDFCDYFITDTDPRN